MSIELFDADEGQAVLDIVREYLLRVPGDLDEKKRHVLGKLMDEAQASMIGAPTEFPDVVTPLRR